MSEATLKVTGDRGQVKLSIDRPGLAAQSVTASPTDLIEQIAAVAGLDVLVDEPVDETPQPPPAVEEETTP